MEPILRFENVSKHYPNGVHALKGVSFEMAEGEFISVIGPSGSGKSTLLRAINRLIPISGGTVWLDGQAVSAQRGAALRQLRRKVGMIFQNYNLVYSLSVLQNVLHGRLGYMGGVKGVFGRYSEEDKQEALDLLKELGLEEFSYNRSSDLSGGQKQRVAIARAIATNPKVLLCDEATSALDPNTTKSILQLLKQINRELGITVIVITHEMAVIEAICDRVAIIDKSHIAEVGKVAEIFSEPKSKIGRQLILGDAITNVKISHSRKIRIIFDGRESMEPVLANMILACKVPVNIMYASTRDVGGKAMGQMIIQLPEDEADAARALHYLKTVKIPFEEVKENDL